MHEIAGPVSCHSTRWVLVETEEALLGSTRRLATASTRLQKAESMGRCSYGVKHG